MGGFSIFLCRPHLISTGRWLSWTALRLARLLQSLHLFRGRRRGCRIRLLGDERWHTRQVRQVAVLTVGVLEFGFPTSGISTHTLPFGIWQDRLFQMGTGEESSFFPQRSVQCPHQPLFQNADTANASLKKIPPALHQGIVIHFQRDLLE